MTASSPAKDSVFVLQAYEVYVVDVQELGGAEIRVYVLLGQFEANAARIRVARRSVVYRYSVYRLSRLCSVAIASHKSVVNVAIPHWRGR